ncbi:R.Pab1 family restriction endonuclease [Pyrococcus abyssi]|uniref:Uncharacterized protein n=1 Tax=Pyrococcus abyssi (strain GE5 / Orsay) TaxID=272844 RepID=G8ZFZ3_PYRAB|nr:R.Pab1 family restriction endonuclease [Pyrococcus abyssi]CCE69534.1 TPA: hypothetical protein PAB0105 [Pyrococcus abyssi GE5]
MTSVEASVSFENGKIVVRLPITRPTSKIRVKKIENGVGIPVSTRKKSFPSDENLRDYYIEWQISYARDGKYDYELSRMVRLAHEHGILTYNDIYELLKFADDVKSYLEDKGIRRESTNEELYGFNIYEDVYPVAKKELPSGEFIGIVLKHKQRAVGYQSMVYVCIPLTNVEPSLAGRVARRNEVVKYEVPVDLMKELLKAFIIASETHKNDIVKFLRSIIGTS